MVYFSDFGETYTDNVWLHRVNYTVLVVTNGVKNNQAKVL